MKALILILPALLAASCTTPYTPTPLPANTVTVTPQPTPGPVPIAPLPVSLSVGRTDPIVGDPISFVASTGVPITRVAWSFGDGGTQQTTTDDTTHGYPRAGTFFVEATVTAKDGRTGTAGSSVTVNPRPLPPATPTPTPTEPEPTGFQAAIACAPKPAGAVTSCHATVTFNRAVQPSGSVYQVNWDFGDGSTLTTFTPVASHTYAGSGSYTVFADVMAHVPPPPQGPGGDDRKVVSTSITVP